MAGSPLRRLAAWAEVRRAAGAADAHDGGAAAAARLAGAPVDAELVLVLAGQPLAADVIADRRAAPRDRAIQHGRDRPPQPVRRAAVEVMAEQLWMQPRLEQRLVRVD